MLALLRVAAKLLLVLLNGAGLATARRECLGQTQCPDQLHQVRVTSGTRHPWHPRPGITETAQKLNGKWNRRLNKRASNKRTPLINRPHLTH
eukprot:1154558-Pelagomonas_calceolata.AAC.2